MDKVRLLLTLITIAINVVPIVGVLLLYQSNLPGLVIPPEINEIINDTSFTSNSVEPPSFVDSHYDVASRTFVLTFKFTNPFNFSVTINSMSADVRCDTHKFPLGNVTLSNPVNIRASETATITVVGTWTQEAANHVQTVHAGAQSIDVELVGITVNVNGINVQMSEPVKIEVPLT